MNPAMAMPQLLQVLETMKGRRIDNYVLPGLSSSLIEHGSVRLFRASRDTEEHITPHSHRFDFACLVLQGEVTNVVYKQEDSWYGCGADRYGVGVLVPIRGGLGGYELRRKTAPRLFSKQAATYKQGDVYSMLAAEIHSIKFSRDAVVLFLEGPEVNENSVILEPWANGEVIPTFRTEPWMFKRAS